MDHVITCTYILALLSDPHEDEKITAEGMMRFLDDLNLNPESIVVLLLAWKFRAATQCEFTREEFANGMVDLGFVYNTISNLWI